MKLLLLVTLVGACAAGLLQPAYVPPRAPAPARTALSHYSGAGAAAARPRAALERSAAILRLESDATEQGFHYAFETENGIRAEESASERDGVQARGGYSYTGDDGQTYSVTYTAGEGGFVAEGGHLPVAPPVPEEIRQALEQNARDEAAGIFDDGSYREGKYSSGGGSPVAAAAAQYEDDEAVVVAARNTFSRQSGGGGAGGSYRAAARAGYRY